MDVQTALELLIFVLPAYLANAIPVLLGGGTAMDFGKKIFDGRRVFGDGKTIRGFFAGIFGGVAAGGVISYFYLSPFFPNVKFQFIAFALMGAGTMVGDALGSFLKRRLGVEAGKPFILDQLMFLVVALLLAMPFASQEAYGFVPLAFLFVITYILHSGSNLIANKLGWKKVPW